MQYLSLYDWLRSLSIMSSSVQPCRGSSLRRESVPLCTHTPFPLPTHLSVERTFKLFSELLFFLNANQTSLVCLPRFLNAYSIFLK